MENAPKYTAYTIIYDLKLIIEYYRGFVKGDDAIKLRMAEKNDNNYDPGFNVLIDFRDIAINWSRKSNEGLARFVQFMKDNPELITHQKTSLLLTKPEQAVLSILIKEQYDQFPMELDLFSTLDSALINIGIPKEFSQRVNEEIEKLKNKA